MQEIWKDIPWCEWSYQVSNFGRVKSLYCKWVKRALILSPWINKWWYSRVVLNFLWKRLNCSIHRMVATVFLDNKNHFPIVCHKDETKTNWALNNSSTNLFWGSYSHNTFDMYRKWRDNLTSKKSVLQYNIEFNLIREYKSTMDVERELWINHRNISLVCNWRRKTAGWFIWRYA